MPGRLRLVSMQIMARNETLISHCGTLGMHLLCLLSCVRVRGEEALL